MFSETLYEKYIDKYWHQFTALLLNMSHIVHVQKINKHNQNIYTKTTNYEVKLYVIKYF